MPQRDPISWNSLINGYIQNGHLARGIDAFRQMCDNGHLPKPGLTASVQSVCSQVGLTRIRREIHGFVFVSGTAIVDFYTRSGDLQVGFQVFDQMEVRNKVSWTVMIRGCTANHDHRMALDCLWRMHSDGIEPNRLTLISVMPACAELCSMRHAKRFMVMLFPQGFESEPSFSAALVHRYSQSGGAKALQMVPIMMEQSTERDVVMWSAIIGSFAEDGNVMEATNHFNRMQMEGIMPNSITLLAMVSACPNQACLPYGRAMHSYAITSGLFSDTCVGSLLISMYSTCGCLPESKLTFTEMPARDSASWSALIVAHGIGGCSNEAMQIFNDMRKNGVDADSITLLAGLTACSHAGLVEEGQELFCDTIKGNKIPLGIEHYACQIDLLGRAGRIEAASEFVRRMPFRPSVKIWSSLVSASVNHGRLEVASV